METDLQLLDCYARTRDAEAFKQLVGRHAGMVFAAARRVTADHHDAEEVAQTCFLELSRHAGSVHGSVAGWLHSVATTHAAKCNRSADRRRRREQIAARPEVMRETPWEDIGPLVDEALAELPEELRLPVVLYYLEDRNQAEVAAELGINQSTVSRRVEAAVAALREKLQAAGVEAPGVALPALLAQHAIVAAPKTLVAAMGKLAVSGLVPAAAGTVAGGGPGGTAMTAGASSATSKGTTVLCLKAFAAVVMTAVVTTVGVSLLPTQQPVAVTASPPAGAQVMSDDLKEIIARVRSETAQGLGDGVTIETETANKSRPAKIKLYAKQGESQLFLYYVSAPRKGWGNPKAKLPAGWPTPGLDNALRFIDQLQAPIVQVTDGHTWWRSQTNDDQTATLLSSRVDAEGQNHPDISTIVKYYFWPDPPALAAATRGDQMGSVDLVRRSENPSLLGLHLTLRQEAAGKAEPILKQECTYWLDPERNDVPVELDRQNYDDHGEKTSFEKNVYLEYAQLPDGRWYPTHWNRFESWGYMDYRIEFFPVKTLDAKWFGDPAARFAGDPGNAVINALPQPVATAAQTITSAVPKAIAATATNAYRSIWWWWPWAVAVGVLGTAAILALMQRRRQPPTPALRGSHGPRRK